MGNYYHNPATAGGALHYFCSFSPVCWIDWLIFIQDFIFWDDRKLNLWRRGRGLEGGVREKKKGVKGQKMIDVLHTCASLPKEPHHSISSTCMIIENLKFFKISLFLPNPWVTVIYSCSCVVYSGHPNWTGQSRVSLFSWSLYPSAGRQALNTYSTVTRAPWVNREFQSRKYHKGNKMGSCDRSWLD